MECAWFSLLLTPGTLAVKVGTKKSFLVLHSCQHGAFLWRAPPNRHFREVQLAPDWPGCCAPCAVRESGHGVGASSLRDASSPPCCQNWLQEPNRAFLEEASCQAESAMDAWIEAEH